MSPSWLFSMLGRCGFVTGQTFVVDGGTSSLMSLVSDFQ